MNSRFSPALFTEISNYSKKIFFKDLSAGLTVGIVALPLAMAFAIASGLPPERGLFTAIVAGFLISFFGGSKVQIGGPTGAFVILVSSITVQFGYSGLAVCTLMAGAMLILFGVFRFGGLLRFIPFPVTTGFTSGIALVIFSTQIKDLLGLNIEKVPADFIEKWSLYFSEIPKSISWEASLIGGLSILTVFIFRRFVPAVPAFLAAMLLTTAVAHLLNMDVMTIGDKFGELPRTLPSPSLPDWTGLNISELFKPALTIALLAAIESLLSATVADGMTGQRHRSNTELVGQGIANIGSVFFGGIPATGAIARTATNVKSGGRTPVAGLIHALTLAVIMLVLAPAAKLIPLASLAGILVVVSINMSEVHHFKSILKGPRSDVLVLLLTFLLTALVDLTVAVQVGIVLSAVLFMRRMANISSVKSIRDIAEDNYEEDEADAQNLGFSASNIPAGVEVFEVSGPFFFGMVDSFKNAMHELGRDPDILVIRMRKILGIDATAINVLKELAQDCKSHGRHLILSGVHSQPFIALEKSGVVKFFDSKNICGNIQEAVNRCQEIIASQKSNRGE